MSDPYKDIGFDANRIGYGRRAGIVVVDFQKGFDANRAGLSVDVLLFLSDWLQHHILIVDKKYSPFFNAKGLR